MTRTISRTARSVAVAGTITAAGLGGLAVPAAAGGVTGCPSGYTVLDVDTLGEAGYLVPALVDDPGSGRLSFGHPGNDDGLVCAVQLGTQTTPWGGPVYNFLDDTLRS